MSDFEQRSRELLQQGTDVLDGHVRSRLTQARFAAVEQARRGRTNSALRSWMPLGGVAAAVLAALVWTNGLQQSGEGLKPATVQVRTSPIDDLDLMAAEENLELMEDVEFYAWLDTQPTI